MVSFEDVNVAITLTTKIDGPNTGVLPFPVTDVENFGPSQTVSSLDVTLRNLAFGMGDGVYTCTAVIENTESELLQHITNSDTGSDSVNVIVPGE